MTDLVLGYLVYLNDENVGRRLPIVEKSLRSLSTFRNQLSNAELLIVNNGGGELARYVIDANVDVPFTLADLNANYMDIAVHFCSFWTAQRRNARYFTYAYDDFVFYDDDWIGPSLSFMSVAQEVPFMRLPEYVHGDPRFDSNITSKSQNPDAVSHSQGADGKPVFFKGTVRIENRTFRLSTFLPNSRPMLWRTSVFDEFAHTIDDRIPVMQTFEQLMYNFARGGDAAMPCGMLDGGVCRTFPVGTSERTRIKNNCNDMMVSLSALRAAYDASVVSS